jgi:2-alkyl-3-oxoalkanoate reductase
MHRKKVIVTGGSGFLGSSLAIALAEKGYEVIAISRSIPKRLIGLPFIHFLQHDLTQPLKVIAENLKNVYAIFHTAAKVDAWGKYKDFYSINVSATEQLLECAQRMRIEYFIYTSSPSVVALEKDICGVDESLPYPEKYLSFYPQTKAIAEKLVTEYTNLFTHVKTISLRPHLIFGRYDTHIIPMIIERAAKNKLKIIGDGQNLVDVSYIEDCVSAHLLALSTLEKKGEKCVGKKYFISQGQPILLIDFINQILSYNNLLPVTRKIHKGLAYSAAWLSEQLALLGLAKEPLYTRFLIGEMSRSHYYSIENAKRDLGYVPLYTVEEALKKTFENSRSVVNEL